MFKKIKKMTSPAAFIGVGGDDVISFGSGQPDLPPPQEVTADLGVRCDLRYGLIQGEKPLRVALSQEYPDSTPDNFIITNGASEALDLIFRSLGKGKILLPKPYYYSYPHLVKFAGMKVAYTNLKMGKIDLVDFKKKIKGCKAVVINSPSNPTGRVETLETLKAIEQITKKEKVWVISDEVYKDLIYERDNYLIKGKNVITVNSFSKTYAMCGVRVGYLWARDQELVNRIIEMKTHTSMNTNLMGQDMALKALGAPKSYAKKQLVIWQSRRDLIYQGLVDLGLDLWRPEGAFYVLPKVPKPEEFALKLYNDYRVITYLGKWFGAPDRIRLSYALNEKSIKEGLTRIADCLKKFR